MCGPSGAMDWCDPSRLKLMLRIVFLVLSANATSLHESPTTAVDYDLHCVNDHLSTINCSLRIAAPGNTSDSNRSYWLTFKETDQQEEFACMLTTTNVEYFCSVNTSSDDEYHSKSFRDLDTYEIKLCHNQLNGSKFCELLDEQYAPADKIKPNAPCCLTVSHNSSQFHFTWKSTYEEYHFVSLTEALMYQLYYYPYYKGDNHSVTSHEINTDTMNFSMDDHDLVPHTEYSARVRSSPNQAYYKGQWSDWSTEVHWRTESTVNVHADVPSNTFVSGLGKVFIPFCVMMPLLFVLCYVPIKKWRQGAFIPTPAPYFHTLYSDCQGDFKSWVVTQEIPAEMMKVEETLQIDTLTKCAVVQKEECQPLFHYHLTEGSTYSNISDLCCDGSLLGIPYAVSTMAPLSAPGISFMSSTLSFHPRSPAEGDSGCWLSSHTSLERDPPLYCNEYCTLSAFQQTSPVPAEHEGVLSTKSYPTGTIRVDAITEA